MTPLEQEILMIVNQIPAAIEKAFMDVFILRHPGHANQKTHGNRFGSGQAKESLRRLKDDKGAREAYKKTHRKRQAKGQTGGISYPTGDEIKAMAKTTGGGLMTFGSDTYGKHVMIQLNTGQNRKPSNGKFTVTVFDKNASANSQTNSQTFSQSPKQLGDILGQLQSKKYRHIYRKYE